MEKEINKEEGELKKSILKTPRRTGLSRIISRRKSISTAAKRANLQDFGMQSKRTADASASEHELHSNEDEYFPETQMKRRKMSSGKTVTSPETGNIDLNIKNTVQTLGELQADISQMKKHMEIHAKYKHEKKELTNLIKLWSKGGNEALIMLQQLIQPKQEFEQIFNHLNLDTNIFSNI